MAKYKMPSIERRVKFELAKRGWRIEDLRQRVESVMKTTISPQRMTMMIKTKSPQTRTLNILGEALGMPVKRFFEEELT